LIKNGLALALAFFVAACAQLPATKRPSPEILQRFWEIHKTNVQALRVWTLQGHVAIHTKQEGWSARLFWNQRGDSYSLRLVAPLGQGTFQLDGTPARVVMRTPKQEVLSAADPETLMQENLGWSFPMTGLRYWVRGIPEPGNRIETLDLDGLGRMTILEQAGWRIKVLEYAQQGRLALPAKIFIDNERLKLRLAVRRWETR
jgi:outer membrane lipoprotein LolB